MPFRSSLNAHFGSVQKLISIVGEEEEEQEEKEEKGERVNGSWRSGKNRMLACGGRATNLAD